jgi:hypothetical protein
VSTTEEPDLDAAPDIPPTLRERMSAVVLLARRQRWSLIAAISIVALAIGVPIGRATAPDATSDARHAVESTVLPLALEADGIWTSSSDGRVAVSEALVELRNEDDPTIVEENLEAWLQAYDASLVRITGADLPPTARPVQRQLITAVTLSRDAVEVLAHAARINDEDLRRDLTTEVGRLRSRSEQLTQAARASAADLDGQRTDIAPLPPLRGFMEGRQG